MTKAGTRMIASARKALAHAKGEAIQGMIVHVPEQVDVKAIRTGLKLSQDQFALQFGFSAAAVRDWEQKRREPERTARILLKVIQEDPNAVRKALAKAS